MAQLMRNGDERAEYGCTVTFENEHGRTWTIHRQGPPQAGLKQACAIALARDDTFRVICISTPESIYGDLQGRLPQKGTTTIQSSEAKMLGRAGLGHMLHQRIRDVSDSHHTERSLRYLNAERAEKADIAAERAAL